VTPLSNHLYRRAERQTSQHAEYNHAQMPNQDVAEVQVGTMDFQHGNASKPARSITARIFGTKLADAGSGQSLVAESKLRHWRVIAINCGRKRRPGLTSVVPGGSIRRSRSGWQRTNRLSAAKGSVGRSDRAMGGGSGERVDQ